MAGETQASLYSQLDLDLSWSEEDLPQVERTKHVHGLHPYLGKYIPQLVNVFLRRYFSPGDWIYDPFVGSGTTLVEANEYGANAIGTDVSAFNCLLSEVKTAVYPADAGTCLESAVEQSRWLTNTNSKGVPNDWLRRWFAAPALEQLLAYKTALDALDSADPVTIALGRIILSRSARSARLTTHFDLDFPRKPTTEAYYCHKHKRICRPVNQAQKFLGRYTADSSRRIIEFGQVRTSAESYVLHTDSRLATLPVEVDGLITSPPYPGLIDYHEQHRYAYELLGLTDRRYDEIGPAARGTSRTALTEYIDSIALVFRRAAEQMPVGAPVIIVVNDSRDLYPTILTLSGLKREEELTRHVNRRTGRRAGEFFESVLVCSTT